MTKTVLVFLLLLLTITVNAQVKLLSWNIENLGKSKSDTTIAHIANIINNYDIVALQEIVAGYGGAQAVANLAEQLNQKGSKWDYTISNPTSSSTYKVERYAFLWKTANVKKIGKAWLEQTYHLEIDREPYFCTFEYNKKQFTIANYHAITKSKQPETEIKYFKFLPAEYPNLNIIFAGDFNCPQSHTVFNPLKKMGYQSAFIKQKTSLKQECINDNCLASEFDNIWYKPSHITVSQSEAIHFYTNFETLKAARKLSDHIPVAISFTFN